MTRFLMLLAGVLAVGGPVAAQAPDAADIAFFETKIRPILVEHCYSCHSEEARKNRKLKADLFLDTRAGVMKGGDTGPAVIIGKSASSLLVKALRHDGDCQMPPGKKLPDAVAADFARWIDLGLPDPRDGQAVTGKREIDLDAGRQFWSFRPLQSPPLPAVKDAAWGRTPIDRFIRAKQEQLGLVPNRPTSREKLARRVYFDLTGLPPTPVELDAFVNDSAPDAYEQLIDRLLASDAYGERWARHWLDVVRFAESGGYEFDGDRPGAYHYRDFVIRAFNRDLPFDEFVRLQVAGDKLKPGDYDAASATGFLVAGPYPGQITAKTVERIRYDQLDDMIATIGSSMLGLTLACVRCHEHKYDPIPQNDYYGIAASLARTASANVPLDPDPAATKARQAEHAATQATLVAALRKYEAEELPARFAAWQSTELPNLISETRWQVAEPVAADAPNSKIDLAGSLIHHGGTGSNTEKLTVTLRTHQTGLKGLRIDAFADPKLPKSGPGTGGDGNFRLLEMSVTARPLDSTNPAKPVVLKMKPIAATFEQAGNTLAHAVDANPGTGWAIAGQTGKDHAGVFAFDGATVGFPGGTTLSIDFQFDRAAIGRLRLAFTTDTPALDGAFDGQHLREIRALLTMGKGNPTSYTRPHLSRWFAHFDDRTRTEVRRVDEHARQFPKPRLKDVFMAAAGGQDVYFLRRGEVDQKQGLAELGFVQVLASSAPPKKDVEPRVALAQWLTDTSSGAGQLLARVIVNRIWQHHFGRGLVGTPNDFGAQGEPPSHPELLDWLAGELIRVGWKLKPMHRLIMASAVYIQGNDVVPENLRLDPANRFLWHRKPQRLEAEAVRDALLVVGGSLDRTMFGSGTLDENHPRRSVYLTVKRSRLVPFLQMFDAPEPVQSVGERPLTTVPTQALALMNSPLVRRQAEGLARRAADSDPSAAVAKAYRIALSRSPTASESAQLTEFLKQQPNPQAGLIEVCHTVLCLNEFVYVD